MGNTGFTLVPDFYVVASCTHNDLSYNNYNRNARRSLLHKPRSTLTSRLAIVATNVAYPAVPGVLGATCAVLGARMLRRRVSVWQDGLFTYVACLAYAVYFLILA